MDQIRAHFEPFFNTLDAQLDTTPKPAHALDGPSSFLNELSQSGMDQFQPWMDHGLAISYTGLEISAPSYKLSWTLDRAAHTHGTY